VNVTAPSRHVLLMNLQLDESTQQFLRLLKDRLPLGFPSVQGWGEITVRLPNPHQGDIGQEFLARILRQARIDREQWEIL
jgi:hypothetical protein